MHYQHVFLLLPCLGIQFIDFTQAESDSGSDQYIHYEHHLKDQAPTDSTFRHRYNALLHSHNPLFGIMSKYFLRNRAQEHPIRKKRCAQEPLQIAPQVQQEQQNLRLHQHPQPRSPPQPKYIQLADTQRAEVRQTRPSRIYYNPSFPNQLQQQVERNRKWNDVAPPLDRFYKKPQTLNNYFKNKEEYYEIHNAAKRQQYQRNKLYNQFYNFNRINKRQDTLNQKSHVNQNQRSVYQGAKQQVKRRFRPSLVLA